MFTVMFQTRREALSLYTYVHDVMDKPYRIEWQNQVVKIGEGDSTMSSQFKESIIDTLTQFIIDFYEEKWVVDIIKTNFYFRDPDNLTDIAEIVRAIFDGEKNDLPKMETLPARQKMIQATLWDIVKDQMAFRFESLETFRLSDYKATLEKYVELAIDEYKLQQEYITFVEKLRGIVNSYRPIHRTIHVKDADPFVLYDDEFYPVNAEQKVRSFYPLLKQWGIETGPSIILSLIGLAPNKIHVYTDRPDHGIMQTLQRVFEERVNIHPTSRLPSPNKT